jgi:tripartite-type tricarboxylate transporter receptor subunit TctC
MSKPNQETRMKPWIHILPHWLVLYAAALAPLGVAAREYPARAVRLIVAALPGSSPDLTARILAEQLRRKTGATFVVENKAGGHGIAALSEVARATPDGYTLLVGNINSNGLAPALHARKYGFDVKAALQPVTLLSDGPSALVAAKGQPSTFRDAVAQWKAHPGKYAYFAAGVGSFGHIWFAKLVEREALDLLFVPVKGGTEGLQLMYEGSVHYAYVPLASFVGQLRKGDVRALFVTGPRRIAELPDVPTLQEAGLPEDFEINTWVGLFAPGRMEPELLKKVHALFVEAVRKDETAAQLRNAFMQQQTSASPAEFKRLVDSRIDGYRAVAERTRIKVEE